MKSSVGEITVHAGLTKDGKTKKVVLHRRISHRVAESLSKEQIEELLAAELKEVGLEPSFKLYRALIAYSYVDKDELKGFDYGDTLIQVSLPYCLHLPNGYDIEVAVPGQSLQALVSLEKVWTRRAAGSSSADLFHETEPVFFQNSGMTPPKFPIDASLGWQHRYEGKNVEKVEDANGTFRFSEAVIQLATGLSQRDIEARGGAGVVDDLTVKALDILNALLDSYRYVTRESYVERLGTLNIHNIYFVNENAGFYVMSMLGSGLGNALMNHPRTTLMSIRSMVAKGQQPPITDLLQLDAEASLSRRAYTLAIVKSFQAIEMFLENFLFSGYLAAGLSAADATRVLDIKWQTPIRLKKVLKDVTGRSAGEGWKLWALWLKSYDSVRNEVIHGGKEPTHAEATDVVKLNADLVRWIEKLPAASTGTPMAKQLLRGRNLIGRFRSWIKAHLV